MHQQFSEPKCHSPSVVYKMHLTARRPTHRSDFIIKFLRENVGSVFLVTWDVSMEIVPYNQLLLHQNEYKTYTS